jgi:hypothetical protein
MQTIAIKLAAESGKANKPRLRRPRVPRQRPAPPPRPTAPTDPAGAETSATGAQNTLLTLGAVLLGIAAVVFAGLYYTDKAGRAFVLVIATTLCLGLPLLARRRLTATAEAIASLGLLLVFLDGYTAYTAGLAGLGEVPRPLYAAVLFVLVAAVAAAYRLASHLRAPQFASILALQPWMPLVAVHFGLGLTGHAAVLGLVAAGDAFAVWVFGRELKLGRRPPATATAAGWPYRLRELAWILFGLSLTASVALGVSGLVAAHTVAGAAAAGGALLLAAAAGVGGAWLSRHQIALQVALGGAVVVVIAAAARVNELAIPNFTVLLTVALAALIALAVGRLPPSVRIGPQLGSLLGAAASAVILLVQTVGIAVAAIRAVVTPRVWAADLATYAQSAHAADVQVVPAVALLAVLATTATPRRWRVDTAVGSGAVALIAFTGSGFLPWWAVPVLAAAYSGVATLAALIASSGSAALVRSATAAVLGLYAVATSLGRPQTTAGVCAGLAAVAIAAAASVALAVRRGRDVGPYAQRVADAALGAAAFTLPIAAGTAAHVVGASPRVLAPVTLLATALGVLGAALSQVAARTPRTVSAGGALAAALGSLVFSLEVGGVEPVDVVLAAVLVAAAAVTAASRAFEVTTAGIAAGVASIPNAVGALVDSVEGRSDDEHPTPAAGRVNAMTLGAALAAAAVVVALARLLAVVVPGIGLVTTAVIVLVISLGVRALPESWRQGPRLGAGVAGGVIAGICAVIAIGEAARAVAAATPFWNADLAAFAKAITAWTPYGAQVPVSLLLAALAAWLLLPAPAGGELGFVTLCLSALALPATLGLPWWSAAAIALGLAVIAGLGAALVRREDPPDTARRRLILAAALAAYAVAAGAAAPGPTGAVLSALAGAGVVIAAIGQVRTTAVPPFVPGLAMSTALLAGPGAAAALAKATEAGRTGVLGSALTVAGFGVLVVWAIQLAGVHWGPWPAAGVGTATVIVSVAALSPAQVWAAGGALIAALAAAALVAPVRAPAASSGELDGDAQAGAGWASPDLAVARRDAAAVIAATVAPGALIAAVASAPAWVAALLGPYRTLRQVWGGYAAAPTPPDAARAVFTLLLLTLVAGVVATTLGGGRFLLSAILPPFAATVVLIPAAMGAHAGAAGWAALGVAAVTGLGAALSPPTLPAAARRLRATAGVVCAATGLAGLSGALATPGGTLVGLAVTATAAGLAATLGRDPAVRMVAWTVASAAAFALPVTALAAAGRPVRSGAFGVLAICAVLIAIAWAAARADRRAEAATVELSALLGGAFALLLALGSARDAAAVMTIGGVLLGGAALRRDRAPLRRRRLVRAGLGAELVACWLLLYSVEVALTEAYTLPFAVVALLAGALELRRRPELSSWIAYGPALAGGLLPSLALVLVNDHPAVWRWITLFAASIVVVLVGSWRRRRAPVVAGAGVAIVVAVTEMIRLLAGDQVAGAILVAVAGVILIGFGALSEQRLRRALRKMS